MHTQDTAQDTPEQTQTPLLSGGYGFCRGGRAVAAPLFIESGAARLIVFTGANGVGKSTLLAGLAGLLEWDAQIAQRGRLPAQDSIVWVGHSAPLTARRRVGDLLQLEALLLGADDGAADAVAAAAAHFALPLDAEVARLSQGWQRRLTLARLVLARQRRLWLIDEPFDLLDGAGEQLVIEALVQHLTEARNGAILALPSGAAAARARSCFARSGLEALWHTL